MTGDDPAGSPFDGDSETEDDDTGNADDDPGNADDTDREPIDLSAEIDSDLDADSDEDTDSDGAADIDSEAGADESNATEPFEQIDVEEEVENPFAELNVEAGESSRDFPEELEAAAGDVDEEPDPFEEMEVEDLDEEEIWAALSGTEEAEVDLGGEATPVETDEGLTDHIVDKREYCQQCPYFTAPPTVTCSHEGTEIVEVVSSEEFRVRGCPMVAEQGPTFKRE